ncbi:glycoside hydrolase family 15 protein [Knoellia sp. Soil729]|uniref:glycoside hydrolase family 15 protein n=1 Tax=Knoellia sp. Soil729 TaxID=1736394 RepID=UPI0006F9CF3F|nr:glycoside hydrolase family 15 protein [Knoellia sp. Soil729]KRE41348.1 glucoamylase [Knoellia sp. Soil729]
MVTPIEDYAVIGDTETAALVSRDGSIDWLCLPRFDSPSCFAALLGTPDNGRWLLRPSGKSRTTRSYHGHSFVLETIHETDTGTVKVIDLLPLGDGRADILRRVEGVSGTVEMEHEWVVRFGYGSIVPWVSHSTDDSDEGELISAIAGPDLLVLRGTRLPKPEESRHRDVFEVKEGEHYDFSMTWFPSWQKVPDALDITGRIQSTIETSEEWVSGCTYEGPHREAVVRSLLVLRLLTDTKRGGIVAAATTSLPEDLGGERNWDYRYCWLRDASLTLESLIRSGFVGAAEPWRDWLVRAVAGDPEDLQIMYAVDGGRDLPERELDHLPGYADSRPVRIGNGAVDQRQTDVLGEVMIALHEAREAGLKGSKQAWRVQAALVNNLAKHWDEPDHGLWEIRGPMRHFTHSRVMVWAAFDRAIKAVEQHGVDGPVDRWRELRQMVHDEVCAKGFDSDRNTFTQHYETDEVDASLLLIPLVGFLPPDDPRVQGTIAAIEKDLLRDGFLMRYRTQTGVDGLSGDEHPFLACSWWLVSAYAVTGQLDKGNELMERLVGLLNDVGLIAEEYDPHAKRQMGNFPQAFSHLTLIGAAHALAAAAEGSTNPGQQGESSAIA